MNILGIRNTRLTVRWQRRPIILMGLIHDILQVENEWKRLIRTIEALQFKAVEMQTIRCKISN